MFNESKKEVYQFVTLVEEPRTVEAIFKSVIAIIGILGNVINLFVLTRNKINITAIYLNAISIVDILRLTSSIAKILEYFQWIHIGHDIYWKYRPIFTIIHFSAQAISLYIVVSFSLNRYIAIRDINRTHFLNTKRANILIIIGIAIISSLARIYISMNIVLKDSVYYDEITHKFCNLSNSQNGTTSLDLSNVTKYINLNKSKEMEIANLLEYSVVTNKSLTYNTTLDFTDYNTDGCKKITYYAAELRDRRNRPPKWHRLTMVVIFGLIPIMLLIIINIKIIVILKESNKRRAALTNAVILQQKSDSSKQKAPLITKENRTIFHLILIKTVISLLRLPYIVYMFFLDYLRYVKNGVKICAYLADYSFDLNAVLNFFLFCILPESNRKQLVETLLKCCGKKRNEKKKVKPAKVTGQANVGGIHNTSFDANEINTINVLQSGVSDTPGDHPKLQQLSSVTSSSSSNTLSSQISQISEI